MRLEFKNGESLEVNRVISVILNVLFVLVDSDYFLVNRHALVGKYGIDDPDKDE